ncbi:PREDICTED: ninja-family protein mc410-like isoform X3 [Populus euphratica]|uniref:Ninja-family protein n=1 Tax=Populus euphratica TaxID=75702 RepID=A0AAJ6Y7S4_POPEU|nr:PREDICTED: ninja-family protein mc410-like isoform X3 [Populus euphratica]
MEDENGLELSLGLGCGGSSSKSKGKNGSSSDTRMDKGDRGNKLVDDFINFLHGTTTQKQDSSARSQRSDSVKPQEMFFNDLTKNNAEANASISLNSRGLWVSSTNRSAENDEEKRPDLGNKRKLLFDELNNQKKHERDAHHADLHDKKSLILITTEDGSTAENEALAESEVEGSTSRLASHHDNGAKQFIGVGGPPEVTKEVRGFSDSSVVELQGQRRLNGSPENEFKQGNLNYGVPFSVQPVSIMNVPYSFPVNKPNSVGAPSTSGHPITGMIQVLPTSNGEQRTGKQSVNPGNLQVMFGYSPVQLPTLDKDNSWGLISHIQQFPASYTGRALSNAEKQNDGLKISQGSTLGQAKGNSKQLIVEVGSSFHTEDDAKGSTMNLRPKDAPKQSTAETLCFDFSAIKPGIGPAMKFGGCGSYPNLPWVSTTLPGPNGRTISGVTYKYSANQIRIVCACHGSHMSPEEFVRHASEENANPGNGNGLATFPGTNPAASTQS